MALMIFQSGVYPMTELYVLNPLMSSVPKNPTTTTNIDPLFDLVWIWHDLQRIKVHL